MSDGTYLYGMTYTGGTNQLGNIFKIQPNGNNYTDIYDFNGTDGSYPYGSLIYDGIYLYGMTSQGGTGGNRGVIFKVLTNGSGYFKILDFDFTNNGGNPRGNLYYDGIYLFAMSSTGGANTIGTIVKVKPDGTSYSKLLDFNGSSNGNGATGSLVSDGTYLYGMTPIGVGINNYGVIFKIKKDGTGYIKLLDFAGSSNGELPNGSFVYDGTFLYGTTPAGGTNSGTIFKIKTDGTGFAIIHNCLGISDGYHPEGSLIFDGTYLYGTARYGGTSNYGTAYELKTDGTGFVKLVDFDGSNKGTCIPLGVICSNDGSCLYGMTYQGGTSTNGVVFKYCLPTGIEEKVSGSDINIYPNPSNGKFIVEGKGILEIYDMMGEKIFSQYMPASTNEIDCSNFPKGIYLVKNISDQMVLIQKIIID